MTQLYYLDEQNEPIGPFPLEKIQTLRKSGPVTDSTLLCVAGGSSWISVGELLPLIPAPAEPVTAAPSPAIRVAKETAPVVAADTPVTKQSPLPALVLVIVVINLAATVWALIPRPLPPMEVSTPSSPALDISTLTTALDRASQQQERQAQALGERLARLEEKLAQPPPALAEVPAAATPVELAPGPTPPAMDPDAGKQIVETTLFYPKLDESTLQQLNTKPTPAWKVLELLANTNRFRKMPEEDQVAYRRAMLEVFRRYPDLRLEESALSKRFQSWIKEFEPVEPLELLERGGLRRAFDVELATQVDVTPIEWDMREAEHIPREKWPALSEVCRDRAARVYPASTEEGSDLQKQIQRYDQIFQATADPLAKNPHYPWILAELAADTMQIPPTATSPPAHAAN